MMYFSRAAIILFWVTLVLGMSVMSVPLNAQIVCPPGSIPHTVVKKMVYNGVCCDVEVKYCVVPGTPTQVILLDATVLDVTCWGLAPGSPPPFSENYFVNYIRDLILRDAIPGTIPTCPTMLNVSIVF
jgi:hypothetical protein